MTSETRRLRPHPQLGESTVFKILVWLLQGVSNLSSSQYLLFSDKPHWISKNNNYSLKIISHY